MQRNGVSMSEYKLYLRMLASGETFSILISKRLLFRTVLPFWILVFFVFTIPNYVFWALVGIPILILYSLYLWNLYRYWSACNISKHAYIVFHISALFCMIVAASIFSKLLEELWILCF